MHLCVVVAGACLVLMRRSCVIPAGAWLLRFGIGVSVIRALVPDSRALHSKITEEVTELVTEIYFWLRITDIRRP